MDNFKGLFERLLNFSQKSPNKEMMIVDNEKVSYHDFLTLCNKISLALISAGVAKGDKVAIILPNHPYWYSIFWAISKTGAIPVPLDPQIGAWELKQFIQVINVKICFSLDKFRGVNHLQNIEKIINEKKTLEKAVFLNEMDSTNNLISFSTFIKNMPHGLNPEEIFQPAYNDELMYACTSGTTGNPKILVVHQGGFYQAEYDMADFLNLDENDTMLIGMPLYHQGGFGMGLQGAIMGSKIIYQSKFDPYKFLEIIQQRKVSVIQLTSTLAKILFSVPDFDKYDLSSLNLAYFAGEILPNEIAHKFVNELDTRVINIIGSSETATMLVWDSDNDMAYDCNSYKKLAFTDVKLLDNEDQEVKESEVGMIHIHTDGILLYYYNNPDETKQKIYSENGKRWFITGDLGKKLANDRILFVGRKKRIIKRGVNLVHPEEIELFLLTHPDIEAVAITLKKDEIIGEAILASIQVKKESDLQKGDIIKFCKGNISSYKIPDDFKITENIPKDIGKVQFKRLLKK